MRAQHIYRDTVVPRGLTTVAPEGVDVGGRVTLTGRYENLRVAAGSLGARPIVAVLLRAVLHLVTGRETC